LNIICPVRRPHPNLSKFIEKCSSKAHKNKVDEKMQTPLISFLVDLVHSHGCSVEDVSITNDSARCMLPPRFCLSNGKEDSACDTEEQTCPLKSPASLPSFDMALAESVLVEIKKISRWESVTSAGTSARPKKNERKRYYVTAPVGPKGPSRRPSAGIPKNKKTTSSDSTLSLPERKESLDNFSSQNVMESPTPNDSFDKLQSGSLQRPNQAKHASALARAILFDQ
jgi:hypothetical protein